VTPDLGRAGIGLDPGTRPVADRQHPYERFIPRAGDTVMPTLNILSICGSLRKGSFNAIVQRALPSLAPEGMTIKPAPSFAEFPLYNADVQNSTGFPPAVNILADAVRAADGVIFCTPEYNFTIPGGLKNAIDWVSRLQNQPFAGKPVALQSASPGPVGGARVQYDMRKAMTFLDAHTLNKPEIFIGNCASKLDEKTGEIKDETTRNFIKQQLASFATYIARVAPKG
jgi:chromate reductase, NAD(P)H dehydrogenase (quinone)